MPKATYHFTTDNGIITLRPTKATYAKALLPALVIWVAGWVGLILMDDTKSEFTEDDILKFEENGHQ